MHLSVFIWIHMVKCRIIESGTSKTDFRTGFIDFRTEPVTKKPVNWDWNLNFYSRTCFYTF